MRRAWRQLPEPPEGFALSIGLPPFQARLLYNRGIRSQADADAYLSPSPAQLNDPLLLPEMRAAVTRLSKALADAETIGVFGDFDTDGVSGTALLVLALRQAGAEVVPYIPHRVDEGHGLNADAVTHLAGKGVSLLITVDCGSSSVEEVRAAASMGIDTVITDHHSLPEDLPDAVALVNPKHPDSEYPYNDLTGAGLSFKLVEALYGHLGRPVPEHVLELAAIGTVADSGPLTGENRYLVREGLALINRTSHVGLRALMAGAGLKQGSLDTESLSFGIIPRLNAAGRLADAAESLRLLVAESRGEAESLAEGLEQQNRQRRELTDEGVAQALTQVDDEAPPSLIMVQHEDWIPGILGLVASDLCERYNRPAIAVSTAGEVARASARSIAAFDMIDALHRSAAPFHRFGGHPRAAGFTIAPADLGDLKHTLVRIADERLDGADLTSSIDIDAEAPPSALIKGFRLVQSMAPFGEGNPTPVFLTRNARVSDVRVFGDKGRHLRMRLAHEGAVWDAVAFRRGADAPEPGSLIDMVYSAGIDNWRDPPTIQLSVVDLRPAQ